MTTRRPTRRCCRRRSARPVRVQWSREDEHGWDPKAPPQLLSLEGAVGDDGKIAAWRTEMWIPKATANLPNMPLLALDAAGIAQTPGLTTGLISQNGDPPYAVAHQEVVVHWLKSSPLRPSNFRAPGKVAQLLRGRELHRHARRRWRGAIRWSSACRDCPTRAASK